MYLMNDQDFRAAANAPLERCQVCFDEGSRAHYCDETGCRSQHSPDPLASDCGPGCVAERGRNPDRWQRHYQPWGCRYAKRIAYWHGGWAGMREAPVKQPRASHCQQEDGRPVANGGGHFREEDVLKRRFCWHVPTGIFRFACGRVDAMSHNSFRWNIDMAATPCVRN